MLIASVCFCILVIIAIAFVWYKWQSLKPYNQRPLKIETFDGLDSPYHPSVLYFENGWNGWKYWLAETPFSPLCKPYRDRNECPSIHVSNDGVSWFSPSGLVNPLVNLDDRGVNEYDYYSDPHLVFVEDRIECYFRLTERHGNKEDFSDVKIVRVYSTDGVQWSKMERCDCPNPIVSPAIVYQEGSGYKMWYVDSESHLEQRNILFSTSSDGIHWNKPEICTLIGEKANPWHIDVQLINKRLYLTIYDFVNITLWGASNDSLTEFELKKLLLRPANKKYGSFYSNGLYRACLVNTDSGVELFFSADDSKSTYIGRAIIDGNLSEPESLKLRFAGPKGLNSEFGQFLISSVYGYKRWGLFVAKNLLRRLRS